LLPHSRSQAEMERSGPPKKEMRQRDVKWLGDLNASISRIDTRTRHWNTHARHSLGPPIKGDYATLLFERGNFSRGNICRQPIPFVRNRRCRLSQNEGIKKEAGYIPSSHFSLSGWKRLQQIKQFVACLSWACYTVHVILCKSILIFNYIHLASINLYILHLCIVFIYSIFIHRFFFLLILSFTRAKTDKALIFATFTKM